MVLLISSSVLGLLTAMVVVFALYERVVSARDRAGLLGLRPEAPSQHAAANVVRARSQFSAAVEAYERELADVQPELQLSDAAGSSLFAGRQGGTEVEVRNGDRLAQLEQHKDVARTQLLDAQRLWESVRPTADADAAVSLWAGFGVLRGWQVGPIGFERAIIRCEHSIDPECWAAWETRRMRFGFALGAESQRLALFAAAVPTNRLGELIGKGMGGSEVALRPGFSPLRWNRRRGRESDPKRATELLLSLRDLTSELAPMARLAVNDAYAGELGEPIENVRSLGDMEGMLSVLSGGPALLVGAWWGKEPAAQLLAGSAHTAWRVRD